MRLDNHTNDRLNDEQSLQVLAVDHTLDRKEKVKQTLSVLSFVWTLVSVFIAIVSVAYVISQNWTSDAVTYTLVALLVGFVVSFILLIVLCAKDLKTGTKGMKVLKFSVKLFNAFIAVLYLVLTAMTMASVAKSGFDGMGQWVVFLATFFVALFKLALVIAKFVAPKVIKSTLKKGKYQVVTFVNGKKDEEKFKKTNKVLEKLAEWNVPKKPKDDNVI